MRPRQGRTWALWAAGLAMAGQCGRASLPPDLWLHSSWLLYFVLPSSSWCCCLVMPQGATSLPPSSGSPGHVSQGPGLSGKGRGPLGLAGPLCQAVGASQDETERSQDWPRARSPARNEENYLHLSSLGDRGASRSTCQQQAWYPPG